MKRKALSHSLEFLIQILLLLLCTARRDPTVHGVPTAAVAAGGNINSSRESALAHHASTFAFSSKSESAMYQPPIVKFPVFSVTWAEATDDDGSCTPAVVAAGGGGAGKTGIGNKITLIAYRGGSKHPEHAIAHEIETSPETPNCVTADARGQLIVASFGRIVRTYANLPSGFHVLAEFQADFAERESAVNSMSFSEHTGAEDAMGGVLLLATGGEDGVLRVWQLSAAGSPGAEDSEGFPEAKGGVDDVPSLQVDLVGECKGHSKPVTCVRFHPSSMLVLTSSKDGTCRLWDWQRGAEAAVMVTSSGLPSSVEAPAVISRSCCFSPDKPDTLYSVQSGRRGSAYVTQWRYRVGEGSAKKSRGQSARQGEDQEPQGETPLTCVTEPVKVACVSGCPATSISIRSDGTRLAVGTVNGAVAVYRLPGFAKVVQYPAHDLPVTGLGFAPGDTGAVLGNYDLVAASADYKITLLKSQGSSFRLAVQQILAFLWAVVSFIFTSTYRVIRIMLSALMTIIPVLGLMVIGASVLYYPENLLDVIERALGVEPLEGGDEAPWDEVDRASIVT